MIKVRGKVLLIIFLVIIALAAAALFLAGRYLFRYALDTDSESFIKSGSKEDENSSEEKSSFSGPEGSEEIRRWFKETACDVYIESEDGLKLHGYEIKNEEGNGRYVIACHGYTSRAEDMAQHARRFYDMGYSLLLPDARAHGSSQGRIIGMGFLERKDMLGWIDMIIESDPEVKIALYGISMGGATVMMTAGEELPSNVCAAIEDCGYTSVWDEFEEQLKRKFRLPSFPLLNIASYICDKQGGYDFKEASAQKQVARCDIPMMFIHGDADDFVPFEMLDKVYESASCEKQKLVIEGAGHAMSSSVAPELYWSEVEKFLDRHMNGI